MSKSHASVMIRKVEAFFGSAYVARDAFQVEWYVDNVHGIAWTELGSFSRTPGSPERLERSKNLIHALIVPINDHLPQFSEHTTMDQSIYDLSVIVFIEN